MKAIDFALSKAESLPLYTERARQRGKPWYVTSDLVAWLRDDVGGVIHDLQRRQSFREYARWPLDHITSPGTTDVRTAIRTVAGLMDRQAKLVLKFLTSPAGVRLGEGFEPLMLGSETVPIGGKNNSGAIESQVELLPSYPSIVGNLQWIIDGTWQDLMSADDYFYPIAGRNRPEQNEEYVTPGEFVVSLNPDLKPLGDCISRSLFRRIDTIKEILADSRSRIAKALVQVKLGAKHTFPAERFAKLAQKTEEEFCSLWDLCWPQDEGLLRDACIILTQIYATFHRNPDLAWLDLSEENLNIGKGHIERLMKHAQSNEMIERVAVALRSVKQLYGEDPPEVIALEEAIAKGGLVLDEMKRTLHWQSKQVKADLRKSSKAWNLIWVLAQNARGGNNVTMNDIEVEGNKAITEQALVQLVSRLKANLPGDLARHIVPAGKRYTYRLDLARSQITLVKQRK